MSSGAYRSSITIAPRADLRISGMRVPSPGSTIHHDSHMSPASSGVDVELVRHPLDAAQTWFGRETPDSPWHQEVPDVTDAGAPVMSKDLDAQLGPTNGGDGNRA